MTRSLVLMLLLAALIHGQIPYTFQAGTVAKAGEVNADLLFLFNKIDSLDKRVASLEKAGLPVGAVAAAMAQMDTSSGIWVLADGRTATTEYFQATGENKVPDLRGMFLRGLNVGRGDGKEDPEGTGRAAASFQADTVQSHNHNKNEYKYLMKVTGTQTQNSTDNTNFEPNLSIVDTIVPFGGLETRPRNSAVYWYVKVK